MYKVYISSLLIYFMTPLVASKTLKYEEVEKIETQLRRRLFTVPRDVKSDIILNVTRLGEERITSKRIRMPKLIVK